MLFLGLNALMEKKSAQNQYCPYLLSLKGEHPLLFSFFATHPAPTLHISFSFSAPKIPFCKQFCVTGSEKLPHKSQLVLGKP